MIGRLRGRLVESDEREWLLDVGGVGFRVQIPGPPGHCLPGDELVLYTHLAVKETDLALYGFRSREQRDLFELLLGVTGVGPRVALALVARFSGGVLADVVATGDTARLAQVPGVGRRVAERLVLDLPAKLRRRGVTAEAGLAEAVSVLVELGHEPDDARDAVSAAAAELGPEAGIEAVVNAARKRLREAR